jgi:SNF2 family DNA or RNA helicase
VPYKELYDWQREDVAKLGGLRAGGIFSDPGTGKTYEGGELVKDGNTILWVAPMQTLEESCRKLVEDMGLNQHMTILDPKNRNGSWNEFTRNQGILFAHWEAIRLMPQLNEASWDFVIADECHKLQGRKTQMTRAMKGIRKVGQKYGMSGTPVTGYPNKYWSVLNWLLPHDFRSYWKFYEQFVDYEIVYPQGYHKITGPKNADELVELLRPFTVRHLKRGPCCPQHPQGVTPWLPDKYYDKVYVDLTPQQRKAYNQMKDDMLAWIGAHEDEPLAAQVVVVQMMRLQQFAMAYATVDGDQVHLSEPSSKIDAVMEIIERDPDEQIVVWSQFKQAIYLLEARCKKAGVPILLYTGDNRATRDANVASFASGGARVFAGTISAGGVGVDGLQYASSTVVFLDRLWSPALNAQAEDRLWRDGQANAVQVIDIMARNTVDRGRHQNLELKWGWIKALLGDKEI